MPPGLHAQAVSRRALVYLHGFASSPRSSKARYFAERAAAAGLRFVAPDLNLPDFHSLTVTRMLDQVDAVLGGMSENDVALVGSSLGAFVAVLAAARRAQRAPDASRPIDRLVLLAPALDLVPGLEADLGRDALADWQQTGRRDVFHFADNRPRTLGWAFMADARRYDAFALSLNLPVLIYQGTRDQVVQPESVMRWASGRPAVTLRLVEDGHQLLEHMDRLWDDVARFLEVDG
jgi:pimeloyl-ACP methyl ester carboxylesterase